MNRDLIAEPGPSRAAAIDPAPFLISQDKHCNDDRIPFGVLRRISRLLDIALSDLVEAPEEPTVVEPGDETRVEAALATNPAGLTRDHLARCFDWPLERVDRSIAMLEYRLRPTGRRVKRLGWHRYVLGPNLAILNPQERSHLARAITEGRGPIDHSTAMTLRHIAQGWWPATITAPLIVRELLQKRLIERRDGQFRLSADVIFSLRLDEH